MKIIVKNSDRAKYLRLTVFADGRIVVTRPRRASNELIKKFVQQKTDWIIKKIKQLRKNDCSTNTRLIAVNDFQINKDKAYELVVEKLDIFNKFYNFKYRKVSIRKQKTRWGSCSRNGNLSFNYRIIDLPEKLADYLIVHELCHLKELNHSSRFWNLVAKKFPDYKIIRKELRRMHLR